MLHVAEAVTHGHEAIMICSVDTDVMLLAISVASKMGVSELWVSFGTGKDHRMLPAQLFARALGFHKCYALPAFHALTGCDATSFFRGKKTAWNVWKALRKSQVRCLYGYHENSIINLGRKPQSDRRFVVLLYDKTSNVEKVWQQFAKAFIIQLLGVVSSKYNFSSKEECH